MSSNAKLRMTGAILFLLHDFMARTTKDLTAFKYCWHICKPLVELKRNLMAHGEAREEK